MDQGRPRGNILVVFWANEYPMRRTIRDHLHAFSKYSDMRVYYVNLRVRRSIPKYLLKVKFDLIIYHTWFLATRWDRELFPTVEEACRPLKHNAAVQIGFPQDEYVNIDHLELFYNEYMDHVFTVAPLDQVDTIYPNVDRARVQFHRVLTGYLDQSVVDATKIWHDQGRPKTLDVGYRSRPGYPYLGRFGLLKGQVAAEFKDATQGTRLTTDISTDGKDTLLGGKWYKFLYRCKYTFGVEGGSHMLDPDGALRQAIQDYQAAHPKASFEEIEAHCFPGRDGEVRYVALSPRHLEACATRTCQVLMEGEYNGILQPDVHYIPLKPDFSNIQECVQTMQDDDVRERIVEAAYRDVVESNAYTYKAFVDQVLQTALPTEDQRTPKNAPRGTMLRLELGNRSLWLLRMLPFLLTIKVLAPLYGRYIEPHPHLRGLVRKVKKRLFGRRS